MTAEHFCQGDCAGTPPAADTLQAAQSALASLTGVYEAATTDAGLGEAEFDALVSEPLAAILNGHYSYNLAFPATADADALADALAGQVIDQLRSQIRDRLEAALVVFATVFGDMCATHAECLRVPIPDLLQARARQILDTCSDGREPPDLPPLTLT
jgi:hypothetical protein